MAGVVHKKNFQYTKVITGIKITGLTIYNSYQLMGIIAQNLCILLFFHSHSPPIFAN